MWFCAKILTMKTMSSLKRIGKKQTDEKERWTNKPNNLHIAGFNDKSLAHTHTPFKNLIHDEWECRKKIIKSIHRHTYKNTHGIIQGHWTSWLSVYLESISVLRQSLCVNIVFYVYVCTMYIAVKNRKDRYCRSIWIMNYYSLEFFF